MNENTLCFVYVTFPNVKEAKAVSKKLIESQLVACANISPPKDSIYPWEGRIEETTEIGVTLKTLPIKLPILKARILELHSYENPMILTWTCESLNPNYYQWVEKELS